MSKVPADLAPDLAGAFRRLSAVERPEVEDTKLMGLLECAGMPLYERPADLLEPAEAKDLLRQNGREELRHRERRACVIDLLGGA